MAKIFTKKDLITAIAAETKITLRDIKKVFAAASKIQKQQVKAGNIVKTPNGSIKLITKKARTGVNPKTGKKITIPAATKPKFTFSIGFRRGL